MNEVRSRATTQTTPRAMTHGITETQTQSPKGRRLKIGVFDSGFGGLTVLRAILKLLPQADSIYLGDTARLPYGSKSQTTISRYAISSAKFIEQQGADLLVVACNTATALALDDIKAAMPIPVVGVVQPGAEAAMAAAPGKGVLVLATAATVQSGAYAKALNAIGLEAFEEACPLLVPLVEEGWTDHSVTNAVLKIYLEEALLAAPAAGTLLLGCTHYPLLEPAIRRTLARIGHPLEIVDSAHATALAAKHMIEAHFSATLPSKGSKPSRTYYATDSVEKFQRLGTSFLGEPLTEVRLVDLGG